MPRKRRKKKKRKIFLPIFLFLFSLSLIIFFLSSKQFFISSLEIHIDGDRYLETKLENFLNNDFFRRRWIFFPRKNILLSRIALRKTIQSSFPELRDLRFRYHWRDLRLYAHKRKESVIWCPIEKLNSGGQVIGKDQFFNDEERKNIRENTKTNEEEKIEKEEYNCYFSDDTSFIFSDAPDLSAGLFTTIYADKKELSLGKQVLGDGKMKYLIDFLKRAEEDRIFYPLEIILYRGVDGDSSLQIRTRLLFGKDLDNDLSIYIPLLNTSDEYDLLIKKFLILKETDLFKKEFFREGKDLSEIDFRIESQIRYLLKESYGEEREKNE